MKIVVTANNIFIASGLRGPFYRQVLVLQ